MKTNKVSKAIRDESEECAKSSEDMRNTPQNREIFHVVSIVLMGIADKLDYVERRKGLKDGQA